MASLNITISEYQTIEIKTNPNMQSTFCEEVKFIRKLKKKIKQKNLFEKVQITIFYLLMLD